MQLLFKQFAGPTGRVLSAAAVLALLASAALQPALLACPFCSAVSQTLRQEMDQSDAVTFATIVPGSESESEAIFEIRSVLRGESLVRVGQKIRVTYFGKAKPDQYFMIMGVDPPDVLWSAPLQVSQPSMDYVRAVSQLPPKDSLARLKFYIEHLEHPESLIARDAYDEFASAPYAEIKQLKEFMDRGQLLKWIQDTSLSQDRKRLYLVMLGVCGQPEDTLLLESLLRSDDPNRRTGLDSLIACYATLKGEAGLELIDELFLANKKSQYADTYAAIMALRFHGTEGGVIGKERVLESMRLILERPELADLVIPDLARWEDWTQVDKLVSLFKAADEKSTWVRVPVINYLRACPLPEAADQMQQLKELDPAAYKRATSFFPVPKASAGSTDSSSLSPSLRERGTSRDMLEPLVAGKQLASLAPLPARGQMTLPPVSKARVLSFLNQGSALGVVCMSALTCWLSMWLAISGAGSQRPVRTLAHRLAPALNRARRSS